MTITDKKQLNGYVADKRLWQGIPTVAVTPGGRVYVAFYSGGTKEYYGNFCVLKRSADGGADFSRNGRGC